MGITKQIPTSFPGSLGRKRTGSRTFLYNFNVLKSTVFWGFGCFLRFCKSVPCSMIWETSCLCFTSCRRIVNYFETVAVFWLSFSFFTSSLCILIRPLECLPTYTLHFMFRSLHCTILFLFSGANFCWVFFFPAIKSGFY